MTTVTVVAVVAGLVVYAVFLATVIQGPVEGNPSDSLLILFGVFGLAAVVTLGVGAAFLEDMSRIGLSSAEKSRWQRIYLVAPPVAAVMYWRKHIRSTPGDPGSETSE